MDNWYNADKWNDIKTEFSSLANNITYSINRHKDFQVVQQVIML